MNLRYIHTAVSVACLFVAGCGNDTHSSREDATGVQAHASAASQGMRPSTCPPATSVGSGGASSVSAGATGSGGGASTGATGTPPGSMPAGTSLSIIDPPPPQPPGAGIWVAQTPAELYAAGGPQPNDVQQYQAPDCVLDATAYSLVLHHPEKITKNIVLVGKTKAGNKVYSVTFYDGTGKPFVITVDDSLLEAGSYKYDPPVTDPSNGSRIMWLSLLRKADAVRKGGYDNLGDPVGPVMTLLSGDEAEDVDPSSSLVEQDIMPLLSKGNAVTASTYESLLFVKNIDPNAYALGGYVCTVAASRHYCMAPQHEYSVVSIDATTITVRNPWGLQAIIPSDTNGPNGLTVFPRAVFNSLFTSIVGEKPFDRPL